MLLQTRGIILRAIPFNDVNAIIHVYTESFGRVAYLSARRRGKRTSVSKALYMPFSALEMEVEHKPKRELQRIRETRPAFTQVDTFRNPIKNILALFIAEIIYRIIRNTEPDKALSNFLFHSAEALELTDKGLANYHIAFLSQLPTYLGFRPNFDGYTPNSCFDLAEGNLTSYPSARPNCLSIADTQTMHRLLKINYRNMGIYSFSRKDRINIIEKTLLYYHHHQPDFGKIKSLDILQTLFN
ncbi:MAG: recombination protein O N-terminal domain-containing protein [Massilibacteroides sp.]|nr:recombination protein O N-terminal domain-containing protein [Massilibacteroides sp.]